MTHRLNPSRRGSYHLLVGPYDEALVRELKRLVPASGRQWMPTAKAWRIANEYVEAARVLIEPPREAPVSDGICTGCDMPVEGCPHLRPGAGLAARAAPPGPDAPV